MPRADDLPSFQALPHHDAVPGQSARRQGLRRGRRDRLVCGRDQRDHGRDRQQQAGNAGDARPRLARHPRLRGAQHYQTTYHRPSSVDEAVALLQRARMRNISPCGHTLIPVMKQRLAGPSDVIDPRQDQGTDRRRGISRYVDHQGRNGALRTWPKATAAKKTIRHWPISPP